MEHDFDRDNRLTNHDLQAMVAALRNVAAYKAAYQISDTEFQAMFDVNRDGLVTADDITAFMNLLTAPANGNGGATVVPEPSSWMLLVSCSFILFLLQALRRSRASS
jgi:hypothetical protein